MQWYIALIILLLPAYLVRFEIAGIPTTLLEILIYLAIPALLISRPIARLGQRLQPVLSRYGWPILLLLLGAIIATIVAPDKRQALGLLKAYVIDPILLFAVIVAGTDTKEQRWRLVHALILGGVILAWSSIFLENEEGRALGLYAFDVNPSPNYLALFLAPIAGLAFGLVATIPGRPSLQRGLIAAAGISLAMALFNSQSRGALLAAGFVFALSFIKAAADQWPKAARYLLWPAIIVLTVGSLTVGTMAALPSFEEKPDHRVATSNNLRYEIWQTTLRDIIPAKPLTGVGLGNYQSYFTELTKDRINYPEFIAPWARTPHNFLLTVWTNLGLLGIIAIIWLVIRFSLDLYRTPKSPLRFGLFLAMLALLIHGLVDSVYWKNDLAALFWTLLAFGYLEANHDEIA